ncbi:MAG: S9 family peptidase [Clostridium sp.]|nr:S9 family peptidase [Clostridium sp.]
MTDVDFVKADKCTPDSLSRLMLNYSMDVRWVKGYERFVVYSKEYVKESDKMLRYYLLDTHTKHTRLLFDSERLVELLTPYADKDKLPLRGRIYLNEISMKGKNSDCLYFTCMGKSWRYDVSAGRLVRVEDEKKKTTDLGIRKEYWKDYSADSLFYVYAYKHNLYLCEVASGDTVQLTVDGEHYHSYASGGNGGNPVEGHASGIGKWVGDTHNYLLIREDKRKVGTLTLVNNLAAPRPKPVSYKFPMPGDKDVVQYSVYEVDADSARIYPLDVKAYPDQIIEIPRFKIFTQSGDYAYFIRKSRAQDLVDLCRVDVKRRELKVLIHEECKPHLNEQLFAYHVLNRGKEILWWSERNGRGQYFLYDGEGKLKNAVTTPDFVSGAIERIDTVGRNIVFHGYGREKGVNPTYRFYYKVGLDGRGLTCLTPGNGYHEATFSPDGKTLADRCSRMDMAPDHNIYDRKGRLVAHLGRCNLTALYECGWRAPEVVQVMAADSVTPLYGVVYTPCDMQPGRTYPVISNVYPGPHTDLVPETFMIDDNGNHSLAQLGFIVINFSYRGSNPYRGRAFYTHGYGNLRDYALADDQYTIRQLAERYPIDLNRVGIYGHSGGGFMTTAAMLSAPDFYKVGVAASGNHDNNIYTQWWGETFHGVTQQTDSLGNVTFSCRIPTNIELAPNLKGHLLLITGDMDNNVHPASTIRMANALIKARKRFDMKVIPGADHGLGDAYYQNLIRYYFVEHLLGEKRDDIDIVKHQ